MRDDKIFLRLNQILEPCNVLAELEVVIFLVTLLNFTPFFAELSIFIALFVREKLFLAD